MNTKPSRRIFGLADAAMILTTFLWGLNAVVSKNAMGDTPETFRVFVFNGLRIPAGSFLLFMTVKASGRSIGIKREHFPLIAAVSFFGMFFFMVGFIYANHLKELDKAETVLKEFLQKFPDDELAPSVKWELKHLGQDDVSEIIQQGETSQ